MACCDHDAARGEVSLSSLKPSWTNEILFEHPTCWSKYLFRRETLVQISLQHLPTMQAGGASGEAPLSGPNKMLSGLFAKAHTQATGLLAKVSRLSGIAV